MEVAVCRECDPIRARRRVPRPAHDSVKVFNRDGRDFTIYLFLVIGDKLLDHWGGGIGFIPDWLPLLLKQMGHGSRLIQPLPFGGDEVAEVPFAARENLLRLAKKVGHTSLGGDKGVMFVGLLNVASHVGEPDSCVFKILLEGRLKVRVL